MHKNVHDFVGKSIEHLMKLSLIRRSYDNVTIVILALKNTEFAL